MATCRHPCSRVTGCFMEAPGTGSSRGVLGWVDASVTWFFFVSPSPGIWGGKASLGVPSYGCCLAAFIPSGLCYLPCVVKGGLRLPFKVVWGVLSDAKGYSGCLRASSDDRTLSISARLCWLEQAAQSEYLP